MLFGAIPPEPPMTRVGPYTWDDFIALDEDDLRELIDGELVDIEEHDLPHEYAVSMLGYFLVGWTRLGHGGVVLGSHFKIRITDRRGLMPDVQLLRRENPVPQDDYNGAVRTHPNLVVEVISKGSARYDRVKKLHWYADRGIGEYWLVDPEQRTLEQLVLANGVYTIAASLEGDEVFRPSTFAGLDVPLAQLWLGAQG